MGKKEDAMFKVGGLEGGPSGGSIDRPPLSDGENAMYRTFVEEQREKFNGLRIDPLKLVDEVVYSRVSVEKDLQSVKNQLQSYGEKGKRGELLEVLLSEFAYEESWLGEEDDNFSLIILSNFDDARSRADMLFEIQAKDGSVARMRIDVTSAADESIINKKMDKAVRIATGNLSLPVKYFKSELNADKGPLDNVPMVVIGMDWKRMNTLCEDIAAGGDLSKSNFQMLILEEIYMQLQAFVAASIATIGPGSQLSKEYEKLFIYFDGLIKKKRALRSGIGDGRALGKDETFLGIIKGLKSHESQWAKRA